MSKMIKCKTCSALIAANAKDCPSCGARNNKPIYKKWLFWVIIILLFPYVANRIIPSNSSTISGVKKTGSELALEQSQDIEYMVIYSDYEKNPINADSKYKDKYWKISGIVNKIDREIMGEPYITFKIDFFKDIRVTFNKSEEEKISKLAKGQKVTIVGKCGGTLLSSTVKFDDCYLIE